ncbi:GL18218 [Drosophila persimilis]|uniref:GL18218 n=1 Tax=Drosophila persimilis TaxID=7234 RepID=B4H4J9_DROPE|nr:protein lin-9 homolog [Drosophila persimilis]XP_026845170.1 protein lin-9 homolog [Drosophila persimilis]XP_026845171.1 protein lin-9 homolog [Drosophila persimilis]EDW32750.1 GL18218 [Drosophila persimilis]
MPVAEATKGKGRKAAAVSTAAAAAARKKSSEEEATAKPMDHDDDSKSDNEQKKDAGAGDVDVNAGEDDTKEGDATAEPEADLEHDEDDEQDSNENSEPEEQVDPPAFSLATLGLQRVGSAPPPKPKVTKAPILTLNARGMPARIRKRNKLFYDENIINDDKPLRMSLAPKKVSGRPPLGAGRPGSGCSGKVAHTAPAKVLKKRKGVVSRYMRSSDNGSSSTSAGSQHQMTAAGNKNKKTPAKGQAARQTQSAGKSNLSGHKSGKGSGASSGGTKGSAAAAAAAATAEEEASQAQALLAANKRVGQAIGLRLRNLLKLPKAHKWAIAEWFYSYIDRPLFDSRDEFLNHVNELDPRLGTRQLNRHEWSTIRRQMGKPRRCSANFFNEERKELDRKRKLMRTLQSRKPGELKDSVLLSDMPDKIPMPLPLGTKVTARLRTPQDGIFSGTVAAYDSLNATYRVTFERPGLGTHAIPDFEIVSENFHEMLPLHSFTKDFRPNLMSIYQTNSLGFTTNLGYTASLSSSYLQKRPSANGRKAGTGLFGPQKHLASNNAAARNALSMKLNKSDPLLGQDAIGESPIRPQLIRAHRYSNKLLEHLVHLEKHIAVKAERINRLNKMNSTAELAIDDMMGHDEAGERHRRQIADNFQRQYAYNIVSIERINTDLMYELTKVQELSSTLTRNPNVQAMISPTYLREECRAKANRTVDGMNNGLVKNERMVTLLKNLTTLLIVTQNLGGDCPVGKVRQVLEGCMEEVRTNLVSADNMDVFHKSVQLRLEFIAQDITRNLEKRRLSRAAAEDVKSPKTPKEEGTDEENDADADDTSKCKEKEDKKKKAVDADDSGKVLAHSKADDTTEAEKETKQRLQEDKRERMDVDSAGQQAEGEDDEKIDSEAETDNAEQQREDAQSPNPAVTDDSQITIESVKESEDEEEEADMVGVERLNLEEGNSDFQDEFIYETK